MKDWDKIQLTHFAQLKVKGRRHLRIDNSAELNNITGRNCDVTPCH